MKKRLKTFDAMHTWSWSDGEEMPRNLRLVGGVDISFVKGDARAACACLTVLRFPDTSVIEYKKCKIVRLRAPYIPGFLAFRECDFLVELIDELRETRSDLLPQVILVDGNGILHPRGFGLASHLGVAVGISTVGIGKSLLAVDGITKEFVKESVREAIESGGDVDFPLIGDSGRCWGRALCPSPGSKKPIFVSVGHMISIETSVRLVRACSRFRIPEPVRQADLLSRSYIRERGGAM